MQWTDDGIVLGVRLHGETSVILELFTREHGRHLGLLRGGRSRRNQAMLQPGNTVLATWTARLDEHLGNYTIEPTISRAARLMEARAGVAGITHLSALARLMPEREASPGLFDVLTIIADALPDASLAAPLIVRLELEVLQDLGFGLDLTECASTGQTTDLIYVSPKTGRAVSREAGEPWKDRLFALPAFLSGEGPMDRDAVLAGFRLTGHFLSRHVFEPRGLTMPDAREAFLRAYG
ncbi:DNA repair protein RecO [Phreatobacter aquaticus]|uniref:DNA repair protein RecO n=1 Tax=Phreatobacter aquaticus TaxID=2570229 RepID=A0A4D7QTH1_9HYPH|nr:DNA repair protein RecO [Phreatobacter aquaticus]QCK87312.1 DNA repair protein RecO [Phreatobacter aquaticus]